MKVKVCGNSDPESLQQLRELPLDYLGFIFVEGSTRAVSLKQAQDLLASGKGDIESIAVFQDAPLEQIASVVSSLSVAGVQLHGSEEVSYIAQLREALPAGTQIWKAIGISEGHDLEQCEQFEGVVDRFVFDTKTGTAETAAGEPKGGSGVKFRWEHLGAYRGQVPYLLAGGIAPGDAPLIKEVRKLQPLLFGIDINSKFEVAPGKKDTAKVEKFLKELHV